MSSWFNGDVAVRSDLAGNVSGTHDDDTVADADDLRQIGRDDEDRCAGFGEIVDDRINLGLGPDIDAACRLVEDQDFWRGRKQARQQHLLLVAAGESAGRHADIGGADAERREGLVGTIASLVTIEDVTELGVPAAARRG